MLHMGQNEFSHLLNSIATLSPDQVQRLYRELETRMASATNVSRPTDDPLLGSMQDHAELMDQIVEDALRHRTQQPLRKQIVIGVDRADRGQMQPFNEEVTARVKVRGRKRLADGDRSDRA
jgi:hypothetical protein